MKAILVVCPGGEVELRRALPKGNVAALELVPEGYDPRAGLLALLGQEPRATWTGPAALGAAAAGIELAEDESAYLLTPVRAEGGRIREARSTGPGTTRDLVEFLREELGGEAVHVLAGQPPILVVAETLVGPPTLSPAPLVGRELSALPAGPPAVLERVLEGTRRACAELGSPVTHLFPNSPAAPLRARPLRETWLGLGPCAALGQGPWVRALDTALGLTAYPCADPLAELARLGPSIELAVVVLPEAPDAPLRLGAPVVVAGEPDGLGRLPVATADSDPGPHSLRDLLARP